MPGVACRKPRTHVVGRHQVRASDRRYDSWERRRAGRNGGGRAWLRGLRSMFRHPAPWAVTALVLLVVAIRLLGSAMRRLTPWIEGWLPHLADNAPGAVGAAWLASVGVLNGSLVAAVAVSLHDSGLVTGLGFFLLVCGARMGSSGVIVVLGTLAAARRPRPPLHEAARLGVLSAIVTLTVYGPVAIAAPLLAPLMPGVRQSLTPPVVGNDATVDGLSIGLLVASLVLLWISLRLLDQSVARMDESWIRRRLLRHVDKPWAAVGVGFVITAASASVAVSIGALLPLFQRGILTRRQAVPYILGANIGTLSDTLVTALALGAYGSMGALLLVAASTAVVTVAIMVAPRWHTNVVAWLQEHLTASRGSFWFSVLIFLGLPALLLIP